MHGCQTPALGQDPASVDQVIAKYLDALGGADKIAAITTFSEKGDLYGVLTQIGHKEKGSFAFYFKAPNLNFRMVLGENNVLLRMVGCDGTKSWDIDRFRHRSEFIPKPGKEYACTKGYRPLPLSVPAPNLRFQLKGKKKVGSQLAWAVKVWDPKSTADDTYYFNAQTYLLIRWVSYSSSFTGQGPFSEVERLYSDYRDVGGIKLPFKVTQRWANSEQITTLREVLINGPIEDAQFQEPGVQGFPKDTQSRLEVPVPDPKSEAAKLEEVEIPVASNGPREPAAPAAAYVNTTNFVSCSLAELQQDIPELKGLKPAENQDGLSELLDQIGSKTVELYRKVPNLIAREKVIESQRGLVVNRQEFSYLTLARRSEDGVTLDEFRVDLRTGAALQTDTSKSRSAATSASSSPPGLEDLLRSSQQLSARKTGGPPLSQGFVYKWLYFYPTNRAESTFRYLGRQRIDGHQTLVVAFAQTPGAVRMPGEIRLENKSFPAYYQGVAWVDAADFRMVRLRTDLLQIDANLPLTQLTAEVQFAETRASGFDALLWLPRKVDVTTQVNGYSFNDEHLYSEYRSFQVHSKILPAP
ncbi:MAG: hypothetical protein ACLQLC_03640 [Candidatus Sulfotelmatobacter sp.]